MERLVVKEQPLGGTAHRGTRPRTGCGRVCESPGVHVCMCWAGSQERVAVSSALETAGDTGPSPVTPELEQGRPGR